MPVAIAIVGAVLWVVVASAQQPSGAGAHSLELSCGVFPPDLTEADLSKRFGADNVSRGPVFGFDDGPQDGTILFAAQADARAEIIWNRALNQPEMILVRERATRWQTLSGIAVGRDLRWLERANGRPFRVRGLRVEGGGGGAILSWGGGKLASSQSAACSIGVYLQPAGDGSDHPDAMRQVVSGREYSSGHPAFHALNLRVVAMAVLFPRVRLGR